MPKKRAIPFILGGIIGAITIMIVSFSMGWVVTSGRAHASATEMSTQAVKEQLAAICLYQFNAQENRADKIKLLGQLKEWEREPYISKEGWATMPGSTSPVSGVARKCAELLTTSISE